MAEITIPDPSLVVLIGAAGAGKSTFAARHFDPSEILSSDAFRALIAGDPADQTVTRAAFGWLHRDLSRRLAERRLSVVDATNVERHARRALLKRASAAGMPAIAVVFDLPVEVILSRNAGRVARMVDAGAVRHHHDRLRAALDEPLQLATEGFNQVILLRDPFEVDAIRIVRRRGSSEA